jgi:hypothetical protein
LSLFQEFRRDFDSNLARSLHVPDNTVSNTGMLYGVVDFGYLVNGDDPVACMQFSPIGRR